MSQSVFAGRSERPVFVLREEPDLAEGLDPAQRELATRLLRAPELAAPRGPWTPPDMDPVHSYGLLVLEGLLLRDVRLGRAASAEVLGPGDILRPWSEPLLFNLVPPINRLLVLHPARFAVLDPTLTALLSRWPALNVALSERLLRRARCMAILLTASHFNVVEDRLLAVLGHLASLWGRVTPDGIVVPFRLTHEHLALIVGATRPTVSVAIGRLKEAGRLDKANRCYVLKDPERQKPDEYAGSEPFTGTAMT